jgi:hypothetical protein
MVAPRARNLFAVLLRILSISPRSLREASSRKRSSSARLSERQIGGLVPKGLGLATVDRAALVEDRYGEVFKEQHVSPGFLADLLGALQVRYPNVPIVFCDTRPLAEEWTFRFLGAALARARQSIGGSDG